MGSVLVNEGPSSEFYFFKGLKQRDPLSQFLFILVMESLHIPFSRVMQAVHVLKCFFLASGLKINMYKSKLMGIGVGTGVVERATNVVGCSTLSTPFTYLGVKVGDCMSRTQPWDDVIRKISSRLSCWKVKTLSIGGSARKWAGSLGIKFWFRSRMVGLGCIQAFHGIRELLEYYKRNMSRKSLLIDIITEVDILKCKGNGDFSVKSVRNLLDDSLLNSNGSHTRWVKEIPIKINVFAWRVQKDRLPTRLNLSRRGIDIQSMVCPNYDLGVQSVSHLHHGP
ncbi:RNA-directed DNA polymerase, eukaryota [Tanacetum coccineum]